MNPIFFPESREGKFKTQMPEKILFVDDEKDFEDLIRQRLRNEKNLELYYENNICHFKASGIKMHKKYF